MSVLVQTKYLSQTNHKPSRVKAILPTNGQSVTISYPFDREEIDCHKVALKALCDKLNIKHTQWVHGVFPSGYIFISTDKTE